MCEVGVSWAEKEALGIPEEDVMTEEEKSDRFGAVTLEEGRGHKPKNAGIFWKLEKAEK